MKAAGFGSRRAGGGKKRAKPATTHAAKVVVQVLFATGKTMTIATLREKLREWFREEVDPAKRAIASLSNEELIGTLLEANSVLEELGLQIRIVNGTATLVTARVDNAGAAEYVSGLTQQSGDPDLTSSALEVLACIAFKQPISQAGIDKAFGADKRGLVVRLRELRLVEEFAGTGGRLHFVTTEAFLRRFQLASIAELHSHIEAICTSQPQLRLSSGTAV